MQGVSLRAGPCWHLPLQSLLWATRAPSVGMGHVSEGQSQGFGGLEDIGNHFPALQLRTRWGPSASQLPQRASEPFRREHHWLLCQCTSSSTWKRHGWLPPTLVPC